MGSDIAQNDSRCVMRPYWRALQCLDTELLQIIVSDESPGRLSQNTAPLLLHGEKSHTDLYLTTTISPFQV